MRDAAGCGEVAPLGDWLSMTWQVITGDCLEVMRGMDAGSVDAVITDPPYGINLINGGGRGMNGWRNFKADGDWDKFRPTREYFQEIRRIGKTVIVWGGNYFTDLLPPSQQWLVWDKGQRNFSLADCEFAWSSQNRASRIFEFPRARLLKENGHHPTQKPIDLMAWCMDILKLPAGALVFDPFCGSGTTGVAAMRTGRRFVGVDVSPRYADIARRRCTEAAEQARQLAMPLGVGGPE